MATFWLTFRIAEKRIGGFDDDERREALYQAIREIAVRKWWVEPTSFILFESPSPIGTIASHVKEAIAPNDDIVLIRSADQKEARIIGPAEPDLWVLMPYVVRA